jgi:hypothetical protein
MFQAPGPYWLSESRRTDRVDLTSSEISIFTSGAEISQFQEKFLIFQLAKLPTRAHVWL